MRIVVFLALAASPAWAIINGVAVDPAKFPQIISVGGRGAECSAALVGSRVILTAAHCVSTGQRLAITIAGKSYVATMERSYHFPEVPHDIALGVVSPPVVGVTPLSVSTKGAIVGDSLQIAGWGCVAASGNSAAGKLRMARTSVVSLTVLDFLLLGDAAFCWGDSGGPVLSGRSLQLVGVGARGDLNRRSLAVRLDTKETEVLMEDYIKRNGVEICGVNAECGALDSDSSAR